MIEKLARMRAANEARREYFWRLQCRSWETGTNANRLSWLAGDIERHWQVLSCLQPDLQLECLTFLLKVEREKPFRLACEKTYIDGFLSELGS